MSEAPTPPSTAAILVAAGRGERLGGQVPKQFLALAGQPLFVHALTVLATSPEIATTVVVVPPGWESEAHDAIAAAGLETHVTAIVHGGARRQDSVRLGLQALPNVSFVLVHDAARPFLSASLVARTVLAARHAGAATAALAITDTLMRAHPGGAPPYHAAEVVDRTGIWAVQTPQVFATGVLRAAHVQAEARGFDASDDGMLALRLGRDLQFVPGDWWNIKVTGPEDLERARFLHAALQQGLLRQQEGKAP